MVYQFDEWDVEMLKAVEIELEIRNSLPADVGTRRQQVINNEDELLSKGKEASIGGQILGWIGVLGLLGIIIGYNYAFSRVRSKYTGKKYYEYEVASRENGSYIFYTSVVVFIISTFYVLLKNIKI